MDFVSQSNRKISIDHRFGSEGALTKSPFNALCPVTDLNNALVSYIFTNYPVFSSAAGHIGHKYKIEHDITLLIPEIWCRMSSKERNPHYLIENGFLEKIEDFTHKGTPILASRLGYRITIRFVHAFLGRIFNNPDVVFNQEILKPEQQGLDSFAEGIKSIVSTQKQVAENYFKDGSIESACPPLKALLHIMVEGNYEGKEINHPDIRNLFKYKPLIESDWYNKRLKTKQMKESERQTLHIQTLTTFLKRPDSFLGIPRPILENRLQQTKEELKFVRSEDYLKKIYGTIGADLLHK